MNARAISLVAAVFVVVLVGAQLVVPSWQGFHSWRYAAALAVATAPLLAYLREARRGADGEVGRRLMVAVLGVLAIAVAGLGSGLLGPDSETVVRAPGTVAPLPALRAAAFFPPAGPAEIASGGAVLLRRPGQDTLELSAGRRAFVSGSAIEVRTRPAVAVAAYDARGNHLTITKPSGSFLSPVLLFPQRVAIAGKELPADLFSTPALGRQVKAFYFSALASSMLQHPGLSPAPAVLFAVDGPAGNLLPGAIGFAQNGRPVTLGGLRLEVTIGKYPELVISAIPFLPALWLGAALIVAGLAWSLVRPSEAPVAGTGPASRPAQAGSLRP
ncbi:MAG: hypothetical protein ACREM2_11735 [Vulcanimicrobiaceae bacterium]